MGAIGKSRWLGRASGADKDESYPITGASSGARGHAPSRAFALSPRDTRHDRLHAALFARLGLGKPAVERALKAASLNGTDVEDELIRSGNLQAPAYYETIASLLALPFLRSIDPGQVILSASIDALLANPAKPLRMETRSGRVVTVLAPRIRELVHLVSLLRQHPELREGFAIASPDTVRDAVWQARAQARVDEVTVSLFDVDPDLSARRVATGFQGFLIGALLALALVALALLTRPTLLFIHLLLTGLFTACVALRLAATAFWEPMRPRAGRTDPPEAELPVYTVLVALYDEAPIVPQLVHALDAIVWPRAKLDVKFVCEANDAKTIQALERQGLGPEYEIVRVPRVLPHTKPKALCYAMSGARGEFVVTYDAEDRPHPRQLLEAYAAFCEEDADLACLQAPLVIANARRSWLTAIFALEYAGLFRGMLPFLARFGLPLPLGGTSNHLRASALRDVGGWDPFNVTEDADLGLRLRRFGYRTGVISRPTFEDAPVSYTVWHLQRCRWFKGWLQTWLVTMRHPFRLMGQIGVLPFCVFQIMTVGMITAALLSPFMVIFLMEGIFRIVFGFGEAFDRIDQALFVTDLIVVFGTYAGFLWLSYRPLVLKEKLAIAHRWIYLPLYWPLMTFAAWHAVWQLLTRPFHWSKTPHMPSEQSVRAANRSRRS